MRNPDRLYKFYNELMNEHMKNFPDWRFFQLINNFFAWFAMKHKNDGFYLEEDEFIEAFKEFVNEMKGREV